VGDVAYLGLLVRGGDRDRGRSGRHAAPMTGCRDHRGVPGLLEVELDVGAVDPRTAVLHAFGRFSQGPDDDRTNDEHAETDDDPPYPGALQFACSAVLSSTRAWPRGCTSIAPVSLLVQN